MAQEQKVTFFFAGESVTIKTDNTGELIRKITQQEHRWLQEGEVVINLDNVTHIKISQSNTEEAIRNYNLY